MNNEQQRPAPESQSQRERDQVFYSREYCRNCGHKHGSGPCGWDAGAGMCGCLEFVDKGPDWPGGPISPTREDGPANSDASEKEGREGCCAARKALEAARMALRDAAYGMSEGSLEDIRNLGVPLALRAIDEVDAALAAPCECDQPPVQRWSDYNKTAAGQMEWLVAEKHGAQADAEREKNTADTLRLECGQLRAQLAKEENGNGV